MRTVCGLTVIMFSVGGCSSADSHHPATARPAAPISVAAIPMTLHGPLIAYGHSYLAADPSYAQAAAGKLGLGFVRRAKRGAKIAQVDNWAHVGPWHWQPAQSDLVLLDATINDVGITALPTFQRHLRSILDTITNGPAIVVLMAPVPVRLARAGPARIAPYQAIIRAELVHYPNTVLADASNHWNPETDIGPDGVHPNDAGRALLAEAVITAVHARQASSGFPGGGRAR